MSQFKLHVTLANEKEAKAWHKLWAEIDPILFEQFVEDDVSGWEYPYEFDLTLGNNVMEDEDDDAGPVLTFGNVLFELKSIGMTFHIGALSDPE